MKKEEDRCGKKVELREKKKNTGKCEFFSRRRRRSENGGGARPMTPSLSSFEYSLSPPNDLYQESRSFCIGCTKRGSGRGGGDIESGGAKDQEQKNGELARTCSGAPPPFHPTPSPFPSSLPLPLTPHWRWGCLSRPHPRRLLSPRYHSPRGTKEDEKNQARHETRKEGRRKVNK